jgi:hypothetical protein
MAIIHIIMAKVPHLIQLFYPVAHRKFGALPYLRQFLVEGRMYFLVVPQAQLKYTMVDNKSSLMEAKLIGLLFKLVDHRQ